MSGSKKLTLRVQSSEGTARVQVEESEPTATLYERVVEALRLSSFGFALHKDRARREEITSSKSRQLRDYNLAHGDMLYLSPVNGTLLFEQPSTSATTENTNKPFGERVVDGSSLAGPSSAAPTSAAPSSAAPSSGKPTIQEDEVDLLLYKESGQIQRQRDDKLCRHNSKGCCVHCSPLEPWDENYLKEHNIKHLSFHAYLRKITSANFVTLNELSFKIKPGCKEHPPWPRGICSSCQPGAATLARQPYRHVDNVVVEHAGLVERFLGSWRASGQQRLGVLLGRWEPHAGVPLGVRARVAAVYEPPQRGARDSLQLQADPRRALLDALALRLGLRPVGWIFTDLLPLDTSAGTVHHIRGVDSHFLSAQECIMAGHFQNEFPNACRHASSGYFGSKFVTVCLTGDSSNAIHMEGYQVSEQCQALVRDGVLLPTRDAPDLAYIRDSDHRQYVPDLYYKERDEYGNEVQVPAKRVPVAYLLVDVPCGVAGAGAERTLAAPPPAALPPAHRPHQPQSLQALHQHIQSADSFLDAMSDLHVLLYLASNPALPLPLATLEPLLAAVRARDAAAAEAWRARPDAATLLQLASHAAPEPPPQAALWTCQFCTFHNAAPHDSCEMCAMPRGTSAM